MHTGRVNPNFSLDDQGIKGLGNVYYNLMEPALIETALKRGEGSLGKGGAFLCTTGKFTGRSPKDKHVVMSESVKDTIWWDNNAEMSEAGFDALYTDMLAHMEGGDYFVQDLVGGADPKHAINVRFVTELAWHNLFIRHMMRRPDRDQLDDYMADFTVINCPSFKANPEKHNCRSDTVIAMNFDRKLILIGGTEYAGENKKSVFSLLNYLLPDSGVMPMHCSANHAIGNPVDTAIFFGLSGTGKTTLSADPSRTLIGDDEHGWSDTGTFNFEGGCYAKTINLSAEAEPEIYATTEKFGTVIENMVYDEETKDLDFDDDSLTANMRCVFFKWALQQQDIEYESLLVSSSWAADDVYRMLQGYLCHQLERTGQSHLVSLFLDLLCYHFYYAETLLGEELLPPDDKMLHGDLWETPLRRSDKCRLVPFAYEILDLLEVEELQLDEIASLFRPVGSVALFMRRGNEVFCESLGDEMLRLLKESNGKLSPNNIFAGSLSRSTGEELVQFAVSEGLLLPV